MPDDLTPVSNPPATHSHNGVDSSRVDFANLANKKRYFKYRIVDSTTNVTATTSVGGDFVMDFAGYFVELGATVDTAGTTGTMTIDVNKNATTIMANTKISIATAVKTSRSSTSSAITTPQFAKGDIITFDTDAVQTTPAKGLTIFATIIET